MAQEEQKSFNLNRPEASAKDEYLFLWTRYETDLSGLICNSDIKFDPRIPRMVRFMISLIAHDAIRYSTEERFDLAVQYTNSRKDLSLDEKNEEIIRICATMCGNITAYIDQYRGIAHQLKVGELVDMSKKYFTDTAEEDIVNADDQPSISTTEPDTES
jgi:hypothetical protein